jgi:dTDP-4-amino-4,6-dideoxygalactose transaminase
LSQLPAFLGGTPTIDRSLHRTWPMVGQEERDAVLRVVDRRILSGNYAPEATALEREFAAWVGAKHALLTHCGTSALELAVAALGIGEGDEVVMPAYSFVATPLSVMRAGAVPVFVDVDEDTGIMDPKLAAEKIGPRTKALMPVHVHGLAAPMDEILALAEKHSLHVIEDAAQAHGATSGGKPVGALGAAGGFSLQSSKNLSAGEGGIFVTNDDALAERANRVRNFGQDLVRSDAEAYDLARPLDGHRPLESLGMGYMYRGNELMAAFARAQLAKLPEWTRLAQKNADRLSQALSELPGVLPPKTPAGRTSVHHKYRVRFDLRAAGLEGTDPIAFRDALLRALRAEGCEAVLWQNQPLPAFRLFTERKGYGRGFPWTATGAPSTDGAFPRTERLLSTSVLLFSQSCPLIAQSEELVMRYADAFARVWAERAKLVGR